MTLVTGSVLPMWPRFSNLFRSPHTTSNASPCAPSPFPVLRETTDGTSDLRWVKPTGGSTLCPSWSRPETMATGPQRRRTLSKNWAQKWDLRQFSAFLFWKYRFEFPYVHYCRYRCFVSVTIWLGTRPHRTTTWSPLVTTRCGRTQPYLFLTSTGKKYFEKIIYFFRKTLHSQKTRRFCENEVSWLCLFRIK